MSRKALCPPLLAAMLAASIGMISNPAHALTGLVYGLLPPFPNFPAQPPLLEDLPYIDLPTGLLPNGVIELPGPPSLPLTNAFIPENGESNTISSCGPGADLRRASLFTILNLQPNNQVMAFARNADGTLCQAGVFNTEGGSDLNGIVASGQNAVIEDDGYLFVANPVSRDNVLFGNGTISVFRIEQGGLVLTDVVDAGNTDTRSVTKFGNLVYVTNGGLYQGTFLGPRLAFIPQSITGFTFDPAVGKLTLLPGSETRTIDAAGDAGQIGFTGDGQHLVISNRATTNAFTSGNEPDTIEVASLGADGTPVRIQAFDVSQGGGDTPFSFRNIGNMIYLAFGGATQNPNGGGAGAFRINSAGEAETVTPFTLNRGTDTCWNAISITTDGPYYWTSAFFDSAIGRFKINPDETMTNLNDTYETTSATGTTNYLVAQGGLDMQITQRPDPKEFIYVINNPIPPALGLPWVRLVGFEVIAGTGEMVKIGSEVARGLPNSGFGIWAL